MLNKVLFVVLLTFLIVLTVYTVYQKDQAAQLGKALQKSHETAVNSQIERERLYTLAVELKKENDALKQRLKRCK